MNPARPTARTGPRVLDEPVLRGPHRTAFAALTIMQLLVLAAVAPALWHATVATDNTLGSITIACALGLVAVATVGRWLSLPLMRRPLHVSAEPGLRVAVVTTFVASQEPLEMLRRTLVAITAMDYPHDSWVLDEEDDRDVRALCEATGARHYTRRGRDGRLTDTGALQRLTKHGNYNAWLLDHGYRAYDVLAGFDPDHAPQPDFLTATLGYFGDPQVGYVQAPQAYANQGASWVARAAAEETYGYYSSTQMTAYGTGYPVVTGCHQLHRMAALRDIGGFACHEADDLLITLHYRTAGWRGIYVPRILARGLAPESWSAYARQQRRWARSALDVKLREFPRAAHALRPIERIVGFAHGIFYLQSLVWILAVAIVAVTWPLAGRPGLLSGHALLLTLAGAAAIWLADAYRQRFYLDPRERGLHWRAFVVRVLKTPWIVLAAIDITRSRRGEYVITPKPWDAVAEVMPEPALVETASRHPG